MTLFLAAPLWLARHLKQLVLESNFGAGYSGVTIFSNNFMRGILFVDNF